jgi:hypothetical protein
MFRTIGCRKSAAQNKQDRDDKACVYMQRGTADHLACQDEYSDAPFKVI